MNSTRHHQWWQDLIPQNSLSEQNPRPFSSEVEASIYYVENFAFVPQDPSQIGGIEQSNILPESRSSLSFSQAVMQSQRSLAGNTASKDVFRVESFSNLLPEDQHSSNQHFSNLHLKNQQSTFSQSVGHQVETSNILEDWPITDPSKSSQSVAFSGEVIDALPVDLDQDTHKSYPSNPQVNSSPITEESQTQSPKNPDVLNQSNLGLGLAVNEFQKDLDAIIGTSSSSPSSAENSTPAAAGSSTPNSTKSKNETSDETSSAHPSHDIFNRLGESMRYANRFDFGAIDLTEKFDEFDKSMAESAQVIQKPSLVSDFNFDELELDQLDLVQELAAIDEAQETQQTQEPQTEPSLNEPSLQPESNVTESSDEKAVDCHCAPVAVPA